MIGKTKKVELCTIGKVDIYLSVKISSNNNKTKVSITKCYISCSSKTWYN